MNRVDITASKEELAKITSKAKDGIDEYITNVQKAVTEIKREIHGMDAFGGTVNQIKEILNNDLRRLEADIKRLESLSLQMQKKIDGYNKFLEMLKRGLI